MFLCCLVLLMIASIFYLISINFLISSSLYNVYHFDRQNVFSQYGHFDYNENLSKKVL